MRRTKKYSNPKVLFICCILAASAIAGVSLYHSLPSSNPNEYNMLPLHTNEKIIDCVKEDQYTYALISQQKAATYGQTLAIFNQDENRQWSRIYENDFANLKPWKIKTADIDGDGEKEILTAVYKTTHFDKNEKNRLFIFNYSEGKLQKKWTGSQIAGVWKDFSAGDFLAIPGDELIFIEKLENQRERVSVYYWFDFGFVLLAVSDTYEDIDNLSIQGENRISITCKTKQKQEVITLAVDNKKLVIRP